MKFVIVTLIALFSVNSFAADIKVNCAAIDNDATYELCIEGSLSQEELEVIAAEQSNQDVSPVFIKTAYGTKRVY